MLAKSVRDLDAYKLAFTLQQRIFALSKGFPKGEGSGDKASTFLR